MNVIQPSPTVFVTLRESTVAMLMALRSDEETLDAVMARCADLAQKVSPITTIETPALAKPSPTEPTPPVVAAVSTWPEVTSGTYVALVLGVPVGARTLGELLGNVVDAIHDLDAAAINRLSEMKARTRHYVACEPENVHAGRRDLPVLQTRSGWWVSANIGRRDLVGSLRAVCRASGLHYGHDIRFPVGSI
jgi:hypothetical protein